jgi:hypothetical protein
MIDPATRAEEFANDWNENFARLSEMATKYNLPKPEIILPMDWLNFVNKTLQERIAPVAVYMGVKIRFGRFEQADVFRTR